jgi:DNA-binding IclR family transcriptional regulator
MNEPVTKAPADEPVVGSVVKALSILRHLADEPGGRGVNAIARSVSLSPSSCFNILKTLVREGFVDFDQQTKNYTIGQGLGLLAHRALGPQNVYPLCSPLLEDSARRYQATMGMLRLDASDHLILLGFVESVSAIRIQMTVGQRLPFLLGADGRCVAAALNLSPTAIEAGLRKLRWQSPPTLEKYLEDVTETKARGWAIDDGNVVTAITTVAAPVVDRDGILRYTVGATVFRRQHTEATLAKIGESLKSTAADIVKTLKI